MDFKASEATFGKPVSVDLKLGLATAPVLYALEEVIIINNNHNNYSFQRPELFNLIKRQFGEKGDVEYAISAVYNVKMDCIQVVAIIPLFSLPLDICS